MEIRYSLSNRQCKEVEQRGSLLRLALTEQEVFQRLEKETTRCPPPKT